MNRNNPHDVILSGPRRRASRTNRKEFKCTDVAKISSLKSAGFTIWVSDDVQQVMVSDHDRFSVTRTEQKLSTLTKNVNFCSDLNDSQTLNETKTIRKGEIPGRKFSSSLEEGGSQVTHMTFLQNKNNIT